MAYPMGEAKLEPLRVDFDRRLKLEFHGSDTSSDGGLLPYRELDDALGLTELGGEVLSETRRGKNTRHLLVGLLRQSVFGRLAGYEDVNDAQRLSHDPVMRAIVDRKGRDRMAASTSQMGRFETEWLATDDNLAALTALSGVWIDGVHDRRPPKMIILDMDSSVSPTHGGQEGPPKTAISAAPVTIRCSASTSSAILNGAPCVPATCIAPMAGARCWSRSSTDTENGSCGTTFVPMPPSPRRRCTSSWRLRASCMRSAFLPIECCGNTLREYIAHLLTRPVGRPPNHVRRYYASFGYRAKSWDKARRVVAKVEWHPGELFPRVGFAVTNLSRPAERVVAFYNQRGTAEQHIKEGKNAINWTRLSCHGFRNNEVRLQLHALAYNLGNFLRTLALPEAVEHWSLTTLREKLIKIGAKVVRHGRYITFQLAEVAIPRSLFANILRLIDGLRPAPLPP